MNITLKKIEIGKKEILNNLIQLYLHNLSLSFPIDFDSKRGLYEYDDIEKYFINENNKAFFILNDNEIAGFMLIDFFEEKNVVQEIFILNNYKRKGIGKIATKILFDEFKGNWEIKAVPCSESAEKFWIAIVKEYTNDNFNLEYVGKYNRAILTFNNNCGSEK